ncbi:MAG: formylglycine-generating enzyme family protein [Kamptonema sp. SIO4C4]|nr:formylglycine-generating enzyme family protein [Kamptonema sp. SIO4C4]
MARVIIRKRTEQAQYYREDLGDGIGLEMVEIPGGTFLMGSPEDELERYDDESPQHEVTVQPFCMGRYPITQEQWKVVVESVEPIKRELKSDPSYFKDSYENYERWSRPVENVTWYDAKEFCARLSKKAGRDYRLPTEAEWEYACRANTTTPFHFGETITTDLANYRGTDDEKFNWSGSYGRGLKGEYRKQTTPVGYFKVANAFGLLDMHGNVLERCEDDWHDNYDGAPTDGSAWLSSNQEGDTSDSQKENRRKMIRGGSWSFNPRYCRSACRSNDYPDLSFNSIGLRVVRSLPVSANNKQ